LPRLSLIRVLVAAAIVLRAGLRLAGGQDAFLTHGYTFYLSIADHVIIGEGFCHQTGAECAVRMPLYPLLLAPFQALGLVYPAVVIVQSMLGGLTVWLAWWIGRELFNERAALLAAAATAFNPYNLQHDTSLQDTALVNALVLAAVALLIAAHRTRREALWAAAGLVIALSILTSARTALFAPAAVWWAFTGGEPVAARMRRTVLLSLPIALLTGGWMLRNAVVVGAPVLNTESGEALFYGNNPFTFSHFPERSIDDTAAEFHRLPAAHLERYEAVSGQELARDRLLGQWAVEYVAAHPLDTAVGALRKLWVVAAAELSPARGPVVQWGYRGVFLIVHALALLAAWRARGREHRLIFLLVLAFAVTTAIFWAHTSHKSFLDPILFIYAAAAVAL
jgi:4-amino-4-deoxy-L-arabinose transferase-like glycosyltransferase